jgi:hypothetical protein
MLLFCVNSAYSIPLRITIDENCNGSFSLNGGAAIGLLCNKDSIDPLNGMSVPTFALTGDTVRGDLVLLEPGSSVASDLIRFEVGILRFYSERPEAGATPPFDASDVGVPTDRQATVVTFNEVGGEGNNGFTYTPGPNDPGFIQGFDTTYVIISDVPEPASISLLACGVSILGFITWRQRRKQSA